MPKAEKNRRVKLIKKFREYPDKVIYEGTLRGALRRIPETKKEQYEIVPLEGSCNKMYEFVLNPFQVSREL